MAQEKVNPKGPAKAAPAKKSANPVVDSLNTNAELAVRAARPYMDQRDVQRPATGLDPTSPGNDAENVPYSEKTVKEDDVETPVETLQSPSLAGKEFQGVEIAARSSDRRAGEDNRWRKRFVVLREAYQPETDAIHARNKIETLNDAINHGVHPKGDPQFDGEQPHPDGVSLYLDYSVEGVPSMVDDCAPESVTPLHHLRDAYDGTTESEKGYADNG